MGWKTQHRKIYEERMIKEALTRLSETSEKKSLPFSEKELWTLAKRHREAFYGSDNKEARLAKYTAHLSEIYDSDVVSHISSKLREINNQIGYEEK